MTAWVTKHTVEILYHQHGELGLLSEDLIDAANYSVDLQVQIPDLPTGTGRWLLTGCSCSIVHCDSCLYQLSVEFLQLWIVIDFTAVIGRGLNFNQALCAKTPAHRQTLIPRSVFQRSDPIVVCCVAYAATLSEKQSTGSVEATRASQRVK